VASFDSIGLAGFGVTGDTVHELLHLLAHPKAGLSSKSVMGFWPKQMIAYAHYEGALSRNRMFWTLDDFCRMVPATFKPKNSILPCPIAAGRPF
jgi:hypothetical protein